MLTQQITFTDFNGVEVTETHYFNLSKAELIELEMTHDGGFSGHLETIGRSNDSRLIFQEFKKLIRMTYGKKSEDGRRFIKSEAISDEFEQSEAFSELIFTFFSDAGKAAEWANGVVPKGLAAEARKIANEKKAQGESTPALSAVPNEGDTESEVYERKFEDYSEDELLALSNEEFQKLVPSHPKDMSKDQLRIAFQRKSS